MTTPRPVQHELAVHALREAIRAVVRHALAQQPDGKWLSASGLLADGVGFTIYDITRAFHELYETGECSVMVTENDVLARQVRA